MNREVFVNIKVKLPKECDVGFSDNDLEEIRNYYKKKFSNFDCLNGEFEVSFVDKRIEQINQLKLQLKEKGKEIKIRNDKLDELKNQLANCHKSLKRKTQSNRDLQHLKHKTNTQLAIQKLEEVNSILYESHYKKIGNKYYAELEDIENVIDQQIKKLKGEKDDTDK
ncbi:MAG TPA: hypothetical protein IAB72_02415 [Candidatus Onthoplasma faecipullorum]|nr:hypothetical protein [Candidatus Onthoplasma faecipullorum]